MAFAYNTVSLPRFQGADLGSAAQYGLRRWTRSQMAPQAIEKARFGLANGAPP
jgi:hypothetical protein